MVDEAARGGVRRRAGSLRDAPTDARALGAAALGVARASYGVQIGLITAIGAVLRLAVVLRQPIGYDEDFTAVVVHQPVAGMLGIVSRDSAPPLFYLAERAVVLAAGWLGVAPAAGGSAPDSTAAAAVLRIVPAVAGLALVPLVAALARSVAGTGAARWTAALVAVAPATVLLSAFARMYEPAAALAVAALLLLWRAVERPSIARWAAYGMTAAAATWTAYFSALALLGILAAALWLRPTRRVALTAASLTALAIASVGPWLVVASGQLEHRGEPFWVPGLSVTTIAGTMGQLFGGPPVDIRLAEAPLLAGLQAASGLAGLAALATVGVAWRRLEDRARTAAMVCLWASGGVLALALISVWRPLLEARYATVMWMPLFALAGIGLWTLPRRLATAVLTLMAATAAAFGAVGVNPQTDVLVGDVESRVGASDIVVAPWDRYLMVLDQADPAVRDRLRVLSAEDLPWYVGTAAYPEGAQIHAIPPTVGAAGGRVFWVADPDEAPPSLPPGYAVLDGRCVRLACLTVYGPPPGGG